MGNIQLAKLVKSDGKYDLTIFSPESIDRIENNIFERGERLFLKCFKRNKAIQVKPEEIVRQLMLDKLIHEYGYSIDLLDVEYTVNFGREKNLPILLFLIRPIKLVFTVYLKSKNIVRRTEKTN